MCAVLCGPLPVRPTKHATLTRLYVNRDPRNQLEAQLLALYDRNPAARDRIVGVLASGSEE